MQNYKYLIGSGWWCSDESDSREKLIGDDFIRSVDFHNLWIDSIRCNSNPQHIVIIDSNSKVKPLITDSRIQFISLDLNAGHSSNHSGLFCGWTRSVLMSLMYADMNDVDYYVYVEQDVLLKGDFIVEKAISSMTTPFMFGRCNMHHNPLQQSFFIISKSGYKQFLSNIYQIKYTDNQMMPERKFALVTSKYFKLIPKFLFVSPRNKYLKRIFHRVQNIMSSFLGCYDYLPYGYGRDRPISFEDKYYYFQHGTLDEINKFKKMFN